MKLRLDRANLLMVYCLFREREWDDIGNGRRDAGHLYFKLWEIFGKNFISRWEKLFQKTERSDSSIDNTNIMSIQLPTLDLERLKEIAILQALEKKNHIQKEAAKLLRLSPRELNYWVAKLGITHPNWKKNIPVE